MKAVVAAFNQRDCTTSPINRFAALVITLSLSIIRILDVRAERGYLGPVHGDGGPVSREVWNMEDVRWRLYRGL